MAFALVTGSGATSSALKQGNSAGSGNTTGIDTTGSNLFAACVSGDAGVGPSDSNTNAWTALTATQNVKLHYCYNPAVGSGHTFAANAASSFASISVAAFSGSASSPFDQENGAFGTSGNTSRTTGSVTLSSPTQDNQLLVMGLGFFAPNGGSASIDIGTVLQSASIIGGSSYGNAIAYEIQTTATTRNPSFSWPSATTGAPAARIATFSAAAAGGAALSRYYYDELIGRAA